MKSDHIKLYYLFEDKLPNQLSVNYLAIDFFYHKTGHF
ncbi:hypothetical protein M23134_05656 [Microscilla marina ATCC 23134]|uniref:Uncharacterized protein n=1 Tax=Microscilla marina ATCC 23134 TaxID=313606 RepID=A1ZIB6_MICM2|nr:hypothetical protein M23134_05656 [Microscilla marina ATCC 23134]